MMWYTVAKLLLFVVASASVTSAMVEFLSQGTRHIADFVFFYNNETTVRRAHPHSRLSTELPSSYFHRFAAIFSQSEAFCNVLSGCVR